MTSIAITGGICSGKSSIISGLQRDYDNWKYNCNSNIQFLSMDHLVSDLYLDTEWLSWLDNEFGTNDRTTISRMAFNNINILNKLNAKSGMKIGTKLGFTMGQAYKQSNILIVEFPLLFECGLDRMFDVVVTVTASSSVRIQRILSRDGKTEEDAHNIISNQVSEEYKCGRSSIIIDTTNMSINDCILSLKQQLKMVI